MQNKISKETLVYAKRFIDFNTPYTEDKQIYDSWVYI